MTDIPADFRRPRLPAWKVVLRMIQYRKDLWWRNWLAMMIMMLFYQIPALRGASLDALVFMALALGFYYAGWARYALKGHRFSLLFAPMLGVPLPMAISPVIYFLAAAVFLRSWPLGIAALLLGVGHVFVSLGEWERCKLAKMYQPS